MAPRALYGPNWSVPSSSSLPGGKHSKTAAVPVPGGLLRGGSAGLRSRRSWSRPRGAGALTPLKPVDAAACAAGRNAAAASASANAAFDADADAAGAGAAAAAHHAAAAGGSASSSRVHVRTRMQRTRRGDVVMTRATGDAAAAEAAEAAEEAETEADAKLSLPRVPVTITGQKSFALWTCMAVSAVMYSVPFGFVRWNLSTIAPLVWWQMAASTAIGTAAALPFLLALTNPAAAYRLNFPILARVSFGVKGAGLPNLARGILGLTLTALASLVGGEAAYGLWGEVMFMFFNGAPLPAEARAMSYGFFWQGGGEGRGRKASIVHPIHSYASRLFALECLFAAQLRCTHDVWFTVVHTQVQTSATRGF